MAPFVALWSIFLMVYVYGQTPLDDFINMPDPTQLNKKLYFCLFNWLIVEVLFVYSSFIDTGITEEGTNIAGHWTAYLVNLTSQTWLNSTYVDRPIWWHWLWIIIPEDLKWNNFATMVGTGNSNSQNYPNKDDEYFRA